MVIMKFGGTSIEDSEAITRVINIIKSEPEKKIVVVSAVAKTTETLTNIFELSFKSKTKQYKEKLIELKKKHEKIIKSLISNQNLLAKTKRQIDIFFKELDKTLKKASKEPKNYDENLAKTLSFGELLSSTIVHTTMLENCINATFIDARDIIITDNNYQKANPCLEQIIKIMPAALNKHLYLNNTIITQGFISSTIEGKTTLLGLEGSDYSASLIGMVMDAKEIQIWTDVDGIMTGDPKKIKNTKPIHTLSFAEASRLASFGAKIIHPLAVDPATQKNIPIKILNSLKPKSKGTTITTESILEKNQSLSITYKKNIENNLYLISIIGKYNKNDEKILKNILKILDEFGIKVLRYETSDANIALTVQENDLIPAAQELHDMFLK